MTDWVWCGYAGHFIGSQHCRFHLATWLPNGWLVSTVGDYYPQGERTTLSIGPEDWYETMVFPYVALEQPDGGHGLMGASQETKRYPTAVEAEAGHMATCQRYAKRKAPRGHA